MEATESFTESYLNSPEYESENEYVTELTRQMTDYMLQDDEKHRKSSGGSDSPQSTLWSPFSPLGPSREPSPSLTSATVDKNTNKVDMKTLIDQQIRSVQTNFNNERRKDQRELKRRNDGVLGNRIKATSRQCGSGARIGSGARTGSGGTGVFLPRGNNSDVESRNQTGNSTSRVIIPARVVEVLKLHHHKIGLSSSLLSSHFSPHHDAMMVTMKNKTYQKSSSSPAQNGPPYLTAISANSHREPPAYLPSEWTY